MAYSDNLGTLLAALNGLTEAEKFNISNAIFTATFDVVNIKDTHPTISQVRSGSKVPILLDDDGYGGFPFTAGDCTLPQCALEDSWSEYKWALDQIGCELVICMESQSSDYLAFWNMFKKMDSSDQGSALVKFIVDRFQRKLLKAEMRTAYFADTDATSDELNGFNGFLPQMLALSTADATLKVAITENAGTIGAQEIATGAEVYEYLKDIYNKAAVKAWFDPSSMVWRMNKTLVNKLVAYLHSAGLTKDLSCSCIDPTKITQGNPFSPDNLSVFGIPVEPMPFEKIMKNYTLYYDGTNGYANKNIIILARREAMILGYEVESTFNRFKLGYDERANEIYVQGASLFGAAVPIPYFIIGI